MFWWLCRLYTYVCQRLWSPRSGQLEVNVVPHTLHQGMGAQTVYTCLRRDRASGSGPRQPTPGSLCSTEHALPSSLSLGAGRMAAEKRSQPPVLLRRMGGTSEQPLTDHLALPVPGAGKDSVKAGGSDPRCPSRQCCFLSAQGAQLTAVPLSPCVCEYTPHRAASQTHAHRCPHVREGDSRAVALSQARSLCTDEETASRIESARPGLEQTDI